MGKRPTLTVTECGVLGLLSLGEASGYDLMKLAESSVGLIWRPVKSQLYTLLPRFVEAGLAERREVRQQTRPDKILYRITDSGREVLRSSLTELTPREGRSGYAVRNFKVFFGDIVGIEHVRQTVEGRRDWVLERLAELEDIEGRSDPEDEFFPLLTLYLAREELQAEVRWADRTLAVLDERGALEPEEPEPTGRSST